MRSIKILTIIANYGTKNDHYLRRLVKEYQSMAYNVHVVVFTNLVKKFSENVEVVVEAPKGDPWGFPFALRRIFAERLNDYDLFIYSEDDTLITQLNISSFLQVTQELPESEIAGFIRSERGSGGERYISTAHAHFHWDPRSVVARGPYLFASFTNEHSACYLLTKEQLRQAIESGGFLIAPHQGRYHLPETAATDPYTQCGFRKVICISRIGDFILPHLPNKYVGKLGVRDTDFFRQIEALEAIHNKERPCTVLLNGETKLEKSILSKSYYEQARQDLLDLIPHDTRNTLTYGCGWGALEEDLAKKGIDVTAVPLDAVIGACAEARGIKVVYGGPQEALKRVSNRQFDCIVATDMLHVHPDPVELLQSLSRLLSASGEILTTVPNMNQLPILWSRVMQHDAYRSLGSFDSVGLHAASERVIRRWFRRAGLKIHTMTPVIPARGKRIHRILGRLIEGSLASEFLVTASKR